MHKMQFVPAIYDIYVCDRRHILRDITIISRKLDVRQATERATRKVEKLQAGGGKYASLQRVRGLFWGEKEYYTKASRGMTRGTSFHEQFHARANDTGLTEDSEMEESAAYAYETFMCGDAARIRRYGWFARQSVRFLFALDTPGQEGLLVDTVSRLARNSGEVIAGDLFAAAMGSAGDCMFYLECLAILRRWGRDDGEKILIDAITLNCDRGPHAARQLLLDELCGSTRERIEHAHGVDLRGFRFRSFNSPKIEDETLVW